MNIEKALVRLHLYAGTKADPNISYLYTVEPRYLELAYFELPLSWSENLVPFLTWNYDNR